MGHDEMPAQNRLADAMKEDLLPAGGEVAEAPAAAAGAAPEELGRIVAALGEAAVAPAARGPHVPPGGSLAGALEALLFVADEPLSARELSDLLDQAPIPDIRAALRELKDRYAAARGGFDLVEVAGGHRLLTRPEYAPWVTRLETVRREERLSKAQLEALAVVAWKQPVLRADVDSMRGADSGGAIRALVEKALVKVAGRADSPGRPLLYGTTDRFLERFGLKSLRDLPRAKDS
jgi:segregation and condensation protein B